MILNIFKIHLQCEIGFNNIHKFWPVKPMITSQKVSHWLSTKNTHAKVFEFCEMILKM